MLLAHLYNESSVTLMDVLHKDYQSESLLLEIGCYLVELQSARLLDFIGLAKKGAVSANYQLRVYSAKILRTLGEEVPDAPFKALPATYSLLFSGGYGQQQ